MVEYLWSILPAAVIRASLAYYTYYLLFLRHHLSRISSEEMAPGVLMARAGLTVSIDCLFACLFACLLVRRGPASCIHYLR